MPVDGVLRGLYNAVFMPERLVSTSKSEYNESVNERLAPSLNLLFVYIFNLVLYAAPLTAAGFGQSTVADEPSWVAELTWLPNPSVWWTYGYAFVQNSLFLLTATVLVFVTYHIAVFFSIKSRGILESATTVVYSTSAYLAGIFTVVWYVSTAPGVETARDLIINTQKYFIYAVIDAMGADVGLPSGRPTPVAVETLTTQGEWIITLLLVLIAYFFYSLYLGTRINHKSGRAIAVLVVAAVLVSPVIYVAGSIIIAT